MVRPKKHLGQHFLTDPKIATRITDALLAHPGETVVEIGPGTGVLTASLLERDIRLIPVEIDPESVQHLLLRWPQLHGKLVQSDFLELAPASFQEESFHIIGNFPYHISSQIFFRVLDMRQQVKSVVCMIQKEVGRRIASPPGSREYGILSVLLQAFYDIEYLFSVKPGSFFPAPRVHSAVLRLQRKGIDKLACDESLFFRVVKGCFNQRRKMIRSSIKSILLNLDSDHELLSKRPEQLGVGDFVQLTLWVQKQIKQE